jgi:hypothetical protein
LLIKEHESFKALEEKTRAKQKKNKVLRLEDNIVICVPFAILTFRTSLQALYNHNFAKCSQKYDAKLTQIKLLTSLNNKVHDFITKIWLVLGRETR